MAGNYGNGAQGGDGTGGGGGAQSSGPTGGGGRGAGDSAHGYGNGPGNQGNNSSSNGGGNTAGSNSSPGQSLAAALGVDQGNKGGDTAVANAHDTAQTMSSMFSMSDHDASKSLSQLGYNYSDRASVVGSLDALATGPLSSAILSAGETAVSFSNPAIGLALQLGDIGQKAYSRGFDSIKGSAPSLAGMAVNAVAGPWAGAAASAGTSLAMGDESGAARTGGGVLGSLVGGYLGGSPISSKLGSVVGSKVGGVLARSAASAAPSNADGGGYSTGGQGGNTDYADGSLSKALLGNTGNTGNTGRTGLNNAVAPKQVISPIQTAMANYSQFS
ncbi:hypothetical protein [Janthinobacterium sp. B9-8]|uniref:hypothetical protein n=1 Tax=Janthinobacterium sp. B9-8 TaxID=1236179 RepID=UPI00061CED43|nr:hypothetical protein [Janthinobacterium sp. B9-8]AMC34727.1 hypothetical protein VN23_08955 [Janthinobacterium sp. B9-8]